MLYLTDQPSTMDGFLPSGLDWQMATLSESDQRIWNIFGQTPAYGAEVPDSAFPDRRVVLVDHADRSQFDAAMEALKQGVDLPDGLICLALSGNRHRGQRARPWAALRGNLHLTAHYRIGAPATFVETGLTMLPAIASVAAIETATSRRAQPKIKWVNDLLLEGRKVSGVLTATHVQGQQVERAIFGIGINVETAPSIEPTPFVPAAGCLAEYQVSIPRLFMALLEPLDAGVSRLRQMGSAGLFPRYRAAADFIGREVNLWPESCDDLCRTAPALSGRVIDLLPDLSLVIEGHSEPLRKGRMAYRVAR